MSGFKDSYIGFTYNNVHSSDLGIVRVSNGSRFNENLLPTIKDRTVQVPGGDGTYYFGSNYTQKQFSVSFAFDSLTEEQLTDLKILFGDKQIHDLIFDETPYKVYSAKVTGTATLKHIPFSEGETNRLYKGEGTIQFTCFWPFARCRYKTKEEYMNIPEYAGLSESEKKGRIQEWWNASRIGKGGNFGDIPAHFTISISGTDSLEFSNGEFVSWDLPTNTNAILNTKTGLAIDTNGNIVNRYITGNSTIRIPVGETKNLNNLQFDCYYI